MRLGALSWWLYSQSIDHFINIMIIMYPNRLQVNINYGMNSKKKSIALPNCIVLAPRNNVPHIIWITPNITLIFILNELKKSRLYSERYHSGSIPKGYTVSDRSSYHRESNKFKGVLSMSLYINPLYMLQIPINSNR